MPCVIWSPEYPPFEIVAGPVWVRARADVMVLIGPRQEGPGTLSSPLCGPRGACRNLLGQNGLPRPSQACNCSHSRQSRAAPVTYWERLSGCADT